MTDDELSLPPQLRDLSYGTRETLKVIANLFGGAAAVEDSPAAWAAAQLGTDRALLVAAREALSPTRVRVVGSVLGADIAEHGALIGGPGEGDPPTWAPFDVGGDQPSSVPSRLVASFPAGTLTETDVCLSISDESYERNLTVFATKGNHDAAHAVLASILQRASGPNNPLRGKTLRARQTMDAMVLEIHPTPADRRDELVLTDEVWREIDLNVAVIGTKHDALERLGLGTSRGILVAGPPGVGKTHLTRVIAAELVGDCTVVFADASAVTHSITDLYHEAEHLGRCVIVLEDVDLVVGHRDTGTDGSVLADFLSTLDGVRQQHGILTIATTNDPGAIDPAAQRSARFDSVVTIPSPDARARQAILHRYLEPLGLDLSLATVAGLEGASGADLREVVRRAVLEFGETFTEKDLADVASSGRWRTTVNTGQYL